jgi:hypothetical protein
VSERYESGQVLLPVGAVIVLFLAGVLDYGLYRTRLIVNSTFNLTPYVVVQIGGNLLLSGLLLAGSWIAVRARTLRLWVGIVLLVLGLVAGFYQPLALLPVDLPLRVGIWRAEFTFVFAGAFVAVLGVYLLLKARLPVQDE